jgi:hypothetical protein
MFRNVDLLQLSSVVAILQITKYSTAITLNKDKIFFLAFHYNTTELMSLSTKNVAGYRGSETLPRDGACGVTSPNIKPSDCILIIVVNR